MKQLVAKMFGVAWAIGSVYATFFAFHVTWPDGIDWRETCKWWEFPTFAIYALGGFASMCGGFFIAVDSHGFINWLRSLRD